MLILFDFFFQKKCIFLCFYWKGVFLLSSNHESCVYYIAAERVSISFHQSRGPARQGLEHSGFSFFASFHPGHQHRTIQLDLIIEMRVSRLAGET